MARNTIEIDREKLRAELRNLGNERIYYMLIDAIEVLPSAKLCKIVGKYLDLELLRPEAAKKTEPVLLADVKRFEKDSLAGKYYVSFNVNSKNYMEKSAGTISWIAEFHQLLDRCVNSAKESDPMETRQAMDVLFSLLDYIDKCNDDVIFFADEGGSWQVGVNWEKALPVWFKCLSITTEPKDYAERIADMLSRHYQYGRDKMLAIARRIATPPQRKALAEVRSA